MGNQLQIFNNPEFGDVRVIGDTENPRFCLADLCRILDLPQVAKVVQRLDKEVLSTHPLETKGGVQEMYFVNEDGFYDVILDSRKPEAKRFRKWVTSEVLPSIRKTGSYIMAQKALPPVGYALDDVKVASEKIQAMFSAKSGIAVAHAIDIVGKAHGIDLDSLKQLLSPAEHETGYLNATQLGEKLGLKPQMTNRLLAECGWEYKDGRNWRLTDAGKAYGEEMPYTRNGHSGYQIRWNEDVVDVLRKRIC